MGEAWSSYRGRFLKLGVEKNPCREELQRLQGKRSHWRCGSVNGCESVKVEMGICQRGWLPWVLWEEQHVAEKNNTHVKDCSISKQFCRGILLICFLAWKQSLVRIGKQYNRGGGATPDSRRGSFTRCFFFYPISQNLMGGRTLTDGQTSYVFTTSSFLTTSPSFTVQYSLTCSFSFSPTTSFANLILLCLASYQPISQRNCK